jgi:hypothetical protein
MALRRLMPEPVADPGLKPFIKMRRLPRVKSVLADEDRLQLIVLAL